MLDSLVVTTALPAIQRAIGERFGRRRVLLAGVALFTAGSALIVVFALRQRSHIAPMFGSIFFITLYVQGCGDGARSRPDLERCLGPAPCLGFSGAKRPLRKQLEPAE